MGGLIGARVRRKEDTRFLTGRGRYTDDIVRPGQVYAHMVRSPHAHARIRGIDARAARAMQGVTVLTGADMAADGIGTLPCGWLIHSKDGRPMVEPPHRPLAVDRVRHVGDQVAVVLAETHAQALDAAEAVVVDYEPLPSVTALAKALAPGAPLVWDEAPGNLCYDWEVGDKAATDAAFRRAAHVTRLALEQNRVAPSPIEPRAYIGEYDAARDSYTLYGTTQGPHLIRLLLSLNTLKVPEERLRVVAPDVGGGFGMKIYHYPEEAIVLWAARRVGRPVKWTADRSESFLSDTYGRDHLTTAELALDGDGRFIGLRVKTAANMGAYLSTFASAIPTFFYANPLPGPYALRAVHVEVKAVFTNTVPVDAYRGAGRPEATYLLERLVDTAARETGDDRVELRRRNFIPAEAFPYRSPLLWTYDTGDFRATLDGALAAADYRGFARRKEASEARGRLRGIGVAAYLEACGMGPSKMLSDLGCRGGQYEVAQVRVHPTGGVSVLTGSHSHGQGHETVFAQIVAERLGLDIDRVDIVHGDTARIPYGVGTYGSRSAAVGGGALVRALDKIVDKARRIAAHLLEAAETDIEFAEGRFRVAGTDRVKTFAEVAAAAYLAAQLPLDRMEPGLEETSYFDPPNFTFPFGCHVCEVEVAPDTGEVTVLGYAAVDDFGRRINPMVVEGQMHGGIAQGIGQALMEGCRHDPASGQVLTGSYMDYCMPRADDLPSFVIGAHESPSAANPLGVKGCGEAGAIAAPAAVINAVVDALAPLGVRHVDMPATPEAVWRAIASAR